MKNILTYIIITSGILITAELSIAQDFWGINCGAPVPFTNIHGNVFVPDREYTQTNQYGYYGTNTTANFPDRNIGGFAGEDTLFFGWREGEFGYKFDVPVDTYSVNLYFCERVYHWKDFREFSISIEGETLEDTLDIYEKTGRNYAWLERFLVYCQDGQLNIDFHANIAEITLSAVSVKAMSANSSPPPQIQNFNVIDGYEMNILYWDYIIDEDLAGYRVYRRISGGIWVLITDELVPQYRYIDKDVSVGTEYEYRVTAVDYYGNESPVSNTLSAVPISNTSTDLLRYEISITDSNLYQLNIDPWSYEYVPADLTFEGNFYPDSWLRYRGSTTRLSDKKNYKFKLQDELYNGREKFNLQSGSTDPSMILERLGYQSYNFLNILNSMSQGVHLERNGEYIGVYLDIEQVDDYFLIRNGLSTQGNLYKALLPLNILGSYQEYTQGYLKENNETTDWNDIIEFIEWINYSSPADFLENAGDWFAVDMYLDMYVVNISDSDYDFVDNNFYMYHNPADDKWYFIPWDHNEGFWDVDLPINTGTMEEPLLNEYNGLIDRLMDEPVFRYSYCKKLERFLNDQYSPTEFEGWVNSVLAEVEFDAIRDIYKNGWERYDSLYQGVEDIIQFNQERVDFLLAEIPGFIPDPDLTQYFKINEIQTNNLSTFSDEAGDYDPWIEIYNLSPVELDLEDYILHYGPNAWLFPQEAIIDGNGFIIVWMDGEQGEGPLHSSIVLNANEGTVWLESRTGSVSDSVPYPQLVADQVWARTVDGTGEWTGNMLPTPGQSNNPTANLNDLVINEFLALNNTVNTDPFGEYDDWLEIYNSSDQPVNMGGLYLTDDFTNPVQWIFPDTIILAGDYLLVWCDNNPLQGPLHTTFAISGNGEQLGLYDRDGITPIDTLTFGAQTDDISFGRFPDGSQNWEFMYPTPGSSNQSSSVTNMTSTPLYFDLKENYPNPFNSCTTINYSVPIEAKLKLTVYDILGREINVLVNSIHKPGNYTISFNANELTSGIYLYRIESADFVSTRKMVLLK